MDGALEFLLKQIANQLSLSNVDTSVLTQNLDQYLPDIYSYSVLIMDVAVKPIAYTLLGFFLLVEFANLAKQMPTSGNSNMGGIEYFIPILLKVGFCTLIMRNVATVMKAIMDVGITVTTNISEIQMDGAASQTIDVTGAMKTLGDLGFFSQMVIMVILLLILLVSMIANVLCKVIVMMRFLELYIYFCLSPIPIATLPNQEFGQAGKNFFKQFAAGALQGALLFIVLSFYPLLMKSAFTLEGTEGALEIAASVAGYSVALIFCLFYTGKWSKAITGAA